MGGWGVEGNQKKKIYIYICVYIYIYMLVMWWVLPCVSLFACALLAPRPPKEALDGRWMDRVDRDGVDGDGGGPQINSKK